MLRVVYRGKPLSEPLAVFSTSAAAARYAKGFCEMLAEQFERGSPSRTTRNSFTLSSAVLGADRRSANDNQSQEGTFECEDPYSG